MIDPIRTYTAAEEERLARNLRAIAASIHRGERKAERADAALLCDFHRALFDGVRSHGGRHRRHDFGSEYLTFGPNRSVHRSEVPDELERIFEGVRRSIASFEDNPGDPTYDEQAFQLALWAHAQLIRVHPFEDGNGRSTRALMTWILVRLGLRPIAIEVPKGEYHDCLNHYFANDDLGPLVDLALRLYPVT